MSVDSPTYTKAVALLRKGLTAEGYVAALDDKANYRRIWARDGIITGLGGLLTREEDLTEGLKNTLLTLKAHQHAFGMIPSNVAFDKNKKLRSVSYGTLSGKVDAALWYVLGVFIYVRKTGDTAFLHRMKDSVDKVFQLLQSWEFNGRGLLYVPQGGHWADEYMLEGYNLSEQLLYYWALTEAAAIDECLETKSMALKESIRINYWPEEENPKRSYHKTAFEKQLQQEATHFWLPGFKPSGYFDVFDCFAHALTFLLDLNQGKQQEDILKSMHQITSQLSDPLLPSFWPPVAPGDAGWDVLIQNWLFEFRNDPGNYQNGGIWPVFNGLLISGLYRSGEEKRADEMKEALENAVGLPNGEFGFYEYLGAYNRNPGGAKYQLWSAAGVIFAEKATQQIFLI